MAKGSSFERAICKTLSVWWTGDASTDVIFWRTAMSGGRATVRRRSGKKTTQAHCGDIAAIDELGRSLTELITFELKRGYNTATLHAMLDCPGGAALQPYESWILQARAASKAAGTRYWAIIHQRDRREVLIHFPHALLDLLCRGQIPEKAKSYAISHLAIRPPGGGRRYLRVASMVLSEFLETFDRKDIKRVLDD